MPSCAKVWYFAAGGLAILDRRTGTQLFLNQGAYNSEYWIGPYQYYEPTGLAYIIAYGNPSGEIFPNFLYAANGTWSS